MRISNGVAEADAVFDEIEELGLQQNVAELDLYGLTVVEPSKAAPEGFALKLRDALIDLARRRTGLEWDLEKGLVGDNGETSPHLHLWWVIMEGEIFEEALMNRCALALVTYLLGQYCILSGQSAMLKAPSDQFGFTPLHIDNAFQPAPLPAYAQVANASWALTDYTRDSGCLCYVPGSHKLCSPPANPFKDVDFDKAGAVPVEVEQGSLIVWHGNTWHGAYARKNPGLRVNLIHDIRRSYMFPEERYKGHVSQEMLDRNPPRFARLLQQEHPFGWEGPEAYDREAMAKATTQWGKSIFS